MRVNVSRLHSGPGHYEYSNMVERCVAAIYAATTQKIIESFSHGYDPTHDFIASGELDEVKVQGGKMLGIEYATATGRPSGILLSHAKNYIMINRGWNNIINAETGKFRVISRMELLYQLCDQLERGIKPTVYPPTANSPGAKVIYIDPRSLADDGWLGFDVALYEENGDTIYDLSEIIAYKKPLHLSDEAITRVLQDITRRQHVY